MDYGRFLTATYLTQSPRDAAGKAERDEKGRPKRGKSTLETRIGSAANKGIAINLGDNHGAMLFDTDLCRMAGGWTGGYLRLEGVAFEGGHGPNPAPADDATMFFEVNVGPGWSKGDDFSDPRKLPTGPGAAKVPLGPLPKDWAKYRGLYLHGDKVLLTYTVGTAGVLELPGLAKRGDLEVLTRTFNIVSNGAAASVVLADGVEKSTAIVENGIGIVSNSAANPEARVLVSVVGAPQGAQLEANGARLSLKLPQLTAGMKFQVGYVRGTAGDAGKLREAGRLASPPEDLTKYQSAGTPHWPQTVATKGTLGSDAQPYTVDTLGIPFDNPYKAWMRIGGMDFFKDGKRAAVSTWSGDVWIVSGIDAGLQNLEWKRYATGLFQALGLKIVDETIYVLGRDQITRLHDLNGDREADWYECFNNDVQVTPGFHEFAFDLQTDPEGNFYFAKGGPVNPGGGGWGPLSDHNGCIFKVSKDGSQFEVFATGVRAPNGIGVGPNGEVTTGDNQGTWVPACYVHLAKKGGFISVADLAHRPETPTDYGRHICFLPMDVDNSGGGQTWVTSDKWGPLKGMLLHTSYGKGTLLGVVMEKVGDTVQGGAFKFPVKFESGIMRPRFNPTDGQLYVVGLKGWQTSGAKDAAFQRVRYTGKPVTFPNRLHVSKKGITIGFTAPLDAETAADAENYSVEQWNYRWSKNYGSADYKVTSPNEKGREPVEVKAARLSPDKSSVLLEIADLQPVMQMRLKLNIKAADGSEVPREIVNTINVVGGDSSLSKLAN